MQLASVRQQQSSNSCFPLQILLFYERSASASTRLEIQWSSPSGIGHPTRCYFACCFSPACRYPYYVVACVQVAIFWRDPQTLQLHPNGCVLSQHGTAGGQCTVKTFHSHVFVGKIFDKPEVSQLADSEVVGCWQADLAKGATQNAPITLQLSVRFWNTGREPVMVFWLDNRGKLPKEVENARVPAASSITIQTIVGHKFGTCTCAIFADV